MSPPKSIRVLAVAVLALFAPASAAQSFPARPIKLVVGYAPASGADVIARLIAAKLSDSLKQSVVVENKPGAGGITAAVEFARAPADGYTLMVGAMPQMIITHVTAAKPAFHPLRDFAPVAQIVSVDLVLVINPQKVPATNLKEFAAWTQKQPVSFFGTPGPGSVGHFLATMYGSATTSKVEPVHFKQTGDSVAALLGGEIHALFVTYTVAASLAKAGKLRALAVTSSTRSPLFPETPTVKEAGFGDLEAGSWYGVLAPAATPAEVLNLLSAEVVKAANSPDMRSKLDEAGMTPAVLPRERFAASMSNDLARWAGVVKSTGFKTQE